MGLNHNVNIKVSADYQSHFVTNSTIVKKMRLNTFKVVVMDNITIIFKNFKTRKEYLAHHLSEDFFHNRIKMAALHFFSSFFYSVSVRSDQG